MSTDKTGESSLAESLDPYFSIPAGIAEVASRGPKVAGSLVKSFKTQTGQSAMGAELQASKAEHEDPRRGEIQRKAETEGDVASRNAVDADRAHNSKLRELEKSTSVNKESRTRALASAVAHASVDSPETNKTELAALRESNQQAKDISLNNKDAVNPSKGFAKPAATVPPTPAFLKPPASPNPRPAGPSTSLPSLGASATGSKSAANPASVIQKIPGDRPFTVNMTSTGDDAGPEVASVVAGKAGDTAPLARQHASSYGPSSSSSGSARPR